MDRNNDIEELITLAAQDQGPEARRRLFRTLRSSEVFMPFDTVEHEGEERKAIPLLRLPDGTHAMMAYTSKEHPDLPKKFGGAVFESALAAALQMPDLDWVIITNLAAQWVSISRNQIPVVLDDLSETSNQDRLTPSAKSDVEQQTLEDLITSSVKSSSKELTAAIASALENRELFLEMSTAQSDDGRPRMKTFKIQHLHRVIRAYTSRLRPGIEYGGIDWPALKEMLRAAPELSGVQIMNDSDDWIVFDRKSLGLEAAPG
ncbi:SseB family protein [Mycobacterium sp. pR1184]|uniref:SseB family protein n=1 Tax=Mycobacterium sp. pR1184 TaxID=3238981 RepID=UPI00351AF733